MRLRRAAISFASDIAEGFSRASYKDKEKLQFYFRILGSLTETQNQLIIVRDVDYITKEEFDKLAKRTIEVSKVANGLIKKSKTVIRNSCFLNRTICYQKKS